VINAISNRYSRFVCDLARAAFQGGIRGPSSPAVPRDFVPRAYPANDIFFTTRGFRFILLTAARISRGPASPRPRLNGVHRPSLRWAIFPGFP
jgi:hypothetical protein